uniref:DNA endonuclease RBBP8 n=1 Tax=Ceratitis capitata TaxID=7213 RepID=W8BGK6_CERCA
MPPVKMDFDLTDRGWVDLYVKKCENIMKEFTNYVYALQNHCIKERSRCEQLDRNYKRLQTKLSENKQQQILEYEQNDVLSIPHDRNINKNILATTPFDADANRSTISDCSPAFLDMAMDSEQLQMETTAALSPAQHRLDTVLSSEQLTSPSRHPSVIDSIFQHNTSPSCKLKNHNENKSALGFLKARGRVGKVLYDDFKEPKLREQNYPTNEDCGSQWNEKGKLQAKRSDWLGKNTKSGERRAGVKRTASITSLDEIQRKRSLMSLNKSSERKLKQSSLTQMVALKNNDTRKDNNSPSPKVVDDAQKLSFSPTTPITSYTSKKLSFPTLPSDTDDIFHFSSDDDDDYDQNMKSLKDKNTMQQNIKKCNDTTFLQPLRHETEKTESVLVITPTAPPIICLDESDDNEQPTDTRIPDKTTDRIAKKVNTVKQEKSNTEKLPTSLAAAMIAEWDEEPEDGKPYMNTSNSNAQYATPTTDIKPRISQLPGAKISIKECFNIDCDDCQKYIDFMGSNMSIAEIEAHLHRCTRHRAPKDCIPVTPPDYWNPLMPSFSESDPRNKTLLEDPCLQRKRGSKQS